MNQKPDLNELKQLNRSATFQRESVDVEKRMVEVAFSSEAEVERWFGKETLSHDAKACDLSRLNDGGAVLFNHRCQPPSGGCVLKPFQVFQSHVRRSSAALGRLCVETQVSKAN